MPRSPFIPLLVLFAAGCSEQGFQTVVDGDGGAGPDIQVDPQELDFGEASQDDAVVQSFTVTNIGSGDLEVSHMEIVGEGLESFTLLSDDLDFILPESASQEVEVSFTPLGADNQEGEVVVHSNDEDTPKETVALLGVGRVPDIDVEDYDFGDFYLECPPESREVGIVNVGDDPVTVSSVSFSGYGFNVLSEPAVPFTLEANGDEQSLLIEFDPDSDGAHTGTITVESDAPGSPDSGEVTGTAHYAGDYTDEYEIPEEPPVDLLWVVDQSGSMDDDQQSLADNFESFIYQLSMYTTDWQIIVVNNYGGCSNTSTVPLTPATSNYQNQFKQAVKSGSESDWNNGEKGLYTAREGVEQTDGGECNSGFMRSDSLLHIIIVSDEEDQSAGDWDDYVDDIVAKKGSEANTRISAVAGDYPSGCGSAEAGNGYYQAVNATGGVFLSICSQWSNHVGDLADASVQLEEFELTYEPDPDTIVVEVNGTERTSGWHYDEAANSVVFDSNIPEGGDTVTVDYSYYASCDG